MKIKFENLFVVGCSIFQAIIIVWLSTSNVALKDEIRELKNANQNIQLEMRDMPRAKGTTSEIISRDDEAQHQNGETQK
ncbi:hypothetical protein HOP61_13350 [Halomonas daqingensis]|uniref:Uncharacterized protein n=1 Tax=Billgrantia desiderata TaxID=52021 RepID=A0AAW4YWA7_9GAMM|nr:hypothetical protein [Halomonas desiderata]MCE8052291.1 hypothetical protein [Halomonas desiderata]